jgi:elongator complex protein 1
LPFLTELSKLEKFEQRYRIDDHLGRREKALRNLRKTGNMVRNGLSIDDHASCLRYMTKHQLYTIGMELYETESSEYKVSNIMQMYLCVRMF